jgi:RNA polymerase sigma factor (sigma-70 family)
MLNSSQIDALWSEYYPKVFAYFYKRISNYADVEDLASITMTVFLDKISQVGILDQPHAYLWTIARSKLADFLRKKQSNREISVEQFTVDVEDNSVVSLNYEKLIQQVFHTAQAVLSADELYLLTLTYQEGKTSQEVATLLSANAATVRKRLSRILSKLKTNLTPIS